MKESQGDYWICKGKGGEIRELEKYQYSFLFFSAARCSEYLYEQYWGEQFFFSRNNPGSRRIAVCQGGHVIPSVIRITGSSRDDLDFVFGYDAIMLSKNNYHDQGVPVFYDIKRWVSDPNRMERIILNNGIKVEVC